MINDFVLFFFGGGGGIFFFYGRGEGGIFFWGGGWNCFFMVGHDNVCAELTYFCSHKNSYIYLNPAI